MTYRTVLEVEQGLRGKVWRVKQCDDDHSAVGEIVACGVPIKASDCRLGSTFETILKIKE
jgi:hypothetical protein